MVQARISDAKSRLEGPDDLRAASFQDEIVVRAYRRYQDALRANGAMDFDDLLMVTAELLESNPAVRERWQTRFRHVLVDEYQDTNHAQYRLVRALGEPQRNVVAVGDDDQGIYSWRGADVRNILDFERDYPDARVVALEQNYRSTGVILRAANAVVSHRPGPGPEPLRDRGLLPHQRPEPGDRGPARAAVGGVRGGRGAALLRARRDPRPARLPAGRRQPGRRGQPGAHDGRAQARRRARRDRQARGVRDGARHPGR
jgi:superfamily I DNA/RNA helicase